MKIIKNAKKKKEKIGTDHIVLAGMDSHGSDGIVEGSDWPGIQWLNASNKKL